MLIFVAVLGAILFIAERREEIAPFIYGDLRSPMRHDHIV